MSAPRGRLGSPTRGEARGVVTKHRDEGCLRLHRHMRNHLEKNPKNLFHSGRSLHVPIGRRVGEVDKLMSHGQMRGRIGRWKSTGSDEEW